jgi:hypothetical protein
MSRTADIDFDFSRPRTAKSVIEAIVSGGVDPYEDDGIHYHVDNTFEWLTSSQTEIGSVVTQLDSHLRLGDTIGFTAVWREERTGGIFLIHSGAETVSFTPSINRRLFVKTDDYTDLGWYVERLVAVFSHLALTGYTARDSYP